MTDERILAILITADGWTIDLNPAAFYARFGIVLADATEVRLPVEPYFPHYRLSLTPTPFSDYYPARVYKFAGLDRIHPLPDENGEVRMTMVKVFREVVDKTSIDEKIDPPCKSKEKVTENINLIEEFLKAVSPELRPKIITALINIFIGEEKYLRGEEKG